MSAGFTLDQDEKVIRRINHHWVDIFSLTFTSGVMILMALAIAYGFGRFRDQFPSFINDLVITVMIAALILIAGLIMVVGLWVFRRNYLLITNQHIIQVEQHGLFGSQVDQVSLGRIQDVSGIQRGLWPTMFGYGTVIVQSAGEARQFIFPRVPEPKTLADYILELHESFLKNNPNSGE